MVTNFYTEEVQPMLKQLMTKLIMIALLSSAGSQSVYPLTWGEAFGGVKNTLKGSVGVLETVCNTLHPFGEIFAGYIILNSLQQRGISKTVKMLTTMPMALPFFWHLLAPSIQSRIPQAQEQAKQAKAKAWKLQCLDLSSRILPWLQHASLVYFIALAAANENSLKNPENPMGF